MEMEQSVQPKVKKGRTHEGPRNHVIGFVISLALTFIAFVAVANGGLSTTFTIFLIVIMAVVQVLIQLIYWMHMKDRGHLFPAVFLFLGGLVFFLGVIAALYWMWW